MDPRYLEHGSFTAVHILLSKGQLSSSKMSRFLCIRPIFHHAISQCHYRRTHNVFLSCASAYDAKPTFLLQSPLGDLPLRRGLLLRGQVEGPMRQTHAIFYSFLLTICSWFLEMIIRNVECRRPLVINDSNPEDGAGWKYR